MAWIRRINDEIVEICLAKQVKTIPKDSVENPKSCNRGEGRWTHEAGSVEDLMKKYDFGSI